MADSDREDSPESDYKEDSTALEDSKPTNVFVNDGSFMEMFKKMQEQTDPPIPSKANKSLPKDPDEGDEGGKRARPNPNKSEVSSKKPSTSASLSFVRLKFMLFS